MRSAIVGWKLPSLYEDHPLLQMSPTLEAGEAMRRSMISRSFSSPIVCHSENEVRITDRVYPMPLVREMPEMRRNSPGEASLSGGDLPPLAGDQGGKADSPCVEP